MWEAFASQLQIPPTAATRGTLRAFVDYLWTRQRAAYSTIDRRLAGVVVTLRQQHHVVVDPEATKAARELLKDYRRQAAEKEEPARGRGKAPAMRLADLQTIVALCGTDIFGLRDRAMLLLGFSIAARRAELAGLRLRNITDDDNGLLVHVAVSKTEPRTVPVPFGKNPGTCPVRAWKAWAKSAQILDHDRHAFRRIHHTGKVQPQGLTPQRAGDLITAAGLRAGSRTCSPGTRCVPGSPPKRAVPGRTGRPSPRSPGTGRTPRCSTDTCRSSTGGASRTMPLWA